MEDPFPPGSEDANRPPTPPTHSFRGHPQPPVNERLQNAKNFLADEDEHRCLGFEIKLSEIEEYLEVIKAENLVHDENLFKDVKIMAAVHRKWKETQEEGVRDTTFQDGPLIQPFSTRLVSAETSKNLDLARAASGLTNQTREDRAPFSVDRQDDHGAFLRAAIQDSRKSRMKPHEFNEDTNLLAVESRAYGWAMRDPALIPVWMHPTRGILNKGLKSDDKIPWYREPDPPSEVVKNRPARGWLPSYLLDLEDSINLLLKKRNPSRQEWSLLEEMLKLIEPEILQYLHGIVNDLLEAQRVGYLGDRQAELDQAIADFAIVQNEWISSFRKDGVYFILRRPGDDEDLEVEQPGVFYVHDGFSSPTHQQNIIRANQLMARFCATGDVDPQDRILFDNLLRFAWPESIHKLEEQRKDFLMRAGANRWEDLTGTAKENSDAFLAQFTVELDAWKAKIKQNPSQFIYLRLGERLPSNNEILLYLPWTLTELPTHPIPLRRDLNLPPSIMMIKQEVVNSLTMNTPSNIDTIIERPGLMASAYPALRSLLIPWAIINKKRINNIALQPHEENFWNSLDSIVQKCASAWLLGFDETIVFKIPLPEHKRDSPRHLYWHGSEDEFERQFDANFEVYADTIEMIREVVRVEGPQGQAGERLKTYLRPFQYPALNRVEEDMFDANDRGDYSIAAALRTKSDRMYNRWIASKEMFRLTITKFDGYLDMDDDPSVIYYRGPLPVVGDLALTASENVIDYLRDFLGSEKGPEEIPTEIRQDFPPEVENALRTYEEWNNPTELEPLLKWYFQTLVDDVQESISSTAPQQASISPSIRKQAPFTPPRVPLPTNVAPLTPESPDVSRIHKPYLAQNILAAAQSLPTPRTTPKRTPGQVSSSAANPGDPINQELGVDLSLILSAVERLEREINDSFTWLRQHLDYWDHFDFQRLWTLLEQFYPDDVRRAQLDVQDCIDRRVIKLMAGPVTPRSNKQYHELFDVFRKRQLQWLKKVLQYSSTSQIRIANEIERKGLLIFNPAVTGRERSCVIRAPAVSGDIENHYPGRALVPQVSELTIEQTRHTRQLLNGPSGINTLLPRWRQNQLNFEESDALLNSLLPVMPRSLFKKQIYLREIDTAARAGQLTPEQSVEFWNLWSSWHEHYEAWLRSLDDNGVLIADRIQEASIDNKRVLRLQIPEFWNMPYINRSRELPYPVRETRDRLEILLNSEREFSIDEIVELDMLLRNVWRPTGQALRIKLHDRLRQDFGLGSSARLDEDHLIIVETILAEAYALFKLEAKSSETARMEIDEPIPGKYEFYYISDGVTRDENREQLERWANEALHVLFPHSDTLSQSRRDFHDLASRLRGGATPNQNEIDRLAIFFQPLSKNDLINLYDDAYQTASNIQSQDSSLNDIIKSFVEAERALLWYRWAFGNTSTDLKVLETIETIRAATQLTLYDPRLDRLRNGLTHIFVDELVLLLSLAGTSPRTQNLPPIPPPNDHQIREVEVEVNNLLARDRAGTITPIELHELNYLLRGVMSLELKTLHDEMARLDSVFVQQPGLEEIQTLTMASATRSFDTRFNRFKQELPRFGIALDHWWYNEEEIAEICSRARLWRDATSHNPSISFLARGLTIESSEVREWHRIYDQLIKFMESNCEDGDEMRATLLLPVLPDHPPARLAPVLEQIREEVQAIQTLERQNDPTLIHNSRHSWLRVMQENFIRDYMNWYTSLPATTLKTLKEQASAGYIHPIDFTPKAEWRGIQRAAIELTLNAMATNQEQHRPRDRFRIVDLPPPYRPTPAEFSSALPLEPSKRPLEQDPFDYSKKLLAYRKWKDYDYEIAREKSETTQDETRRNYIDTIETPPNFFGPFVVPGVEDMRTAKQELLVRLTGISETLRLSQEKAPRPLLGFMLKDINEVIRRLPEIHRQGLPDSDFRLTRDDIDLLQLMAEESWDEESLPYDANIPGITDIPGELARFREFERDIEEQIKQAQIPLWKPTHPEPPPHLTTEEKIELSVQIPHNDTESSTQYILLEELLDSINTKRLGIVGPQQARLQPWTLVDANSYLIQMAKKKRIHMDEPVDEDLIGKRRISKIPLSGHPENRYITSIEDPKNLPGVKINQVSGQLQVRYDKFGSKGPPIFQPNKARHFFAISRKLVINIAKLLSELADPTTPLGSNKRDALACLTDREENARANMTGVPRPDAPDSNIITIRKLALDLLRVAPDLADEAGITGNRLRALNDVDAATILQMQLLEECNNNWEFRFPEEEHVWDFAAPRITQTQRRFRNRKVLVQPTLVRYFNMRRHPPEYQSSAAQALIKQSGPQIEEKSQNIPRAEHLANGTVARAPTATNVAHKLAAIIKNRTTANRSDNTTINKGGQLPPAVGDQYAAAVKRLPMKVDRHIKGQRPHFPFGETPYQSAYLSFKMENELKDVPEFRPSRPSKSSNFFTLNRKRKRSPSPEPTNSYALPTLPTDWRPGNISLAQARLQLIEEALEAPGFPDADNLEYYYTPDEIRDIKRREAWLKTQDEVREGVKLVEQDTGRNYEDLTPKEAWEARERVGIDHYSGKVIRPDANVTPAATNSRGKNSAVATLDAGRGSIVRKPIEGLSARRAALRAQRGPRRA